VTTPPSRFPLALFAALAALAAACQPSQPQPNPRLPVTHMRLASQDFTMEIAADEQSRRLGLMERDSLPPDHGMLFVFPKATEQLFWNHHVRFPLDVVFLDPRGTVVSTVHMDPYSDLNVSSEANAKYAIELNAGTAERLHLVNGTHLDIPPEADKNLRPDK
jgi:hypothetical protein